jgi:YD repeat-containing protein
VGSGEETRTSFLYDRVGNLLEEKDGRTTGRPFDVRNVYDDLNRLVSVEDAEGKVTTYEYDGEGNRTAVVEPKGVSYRTEYEYGERNELLAVRMADGGEYQYEYDGNLNRTEQTDAEGNGVSFTYDVLNRVDLMTQDPGGFAYVTHHDYDENGNETKLTDPKGQVVDFEYDELNRLKSKVYHLTAADLALYTSDPSHRLRVRPER